MHPTSGRSSNQYDLDPLRPVFNRTLDARCRIDVWRSPEDIGSYVRAFDALPPDPGDPTHR